MKILGIESATITASCAVSEKDVLLCEYSQSYNKTHSEKLMPLIIQALKDNSITVDELDYIAISKGPGSYTGLRIGASIAKGFSIAKDLPIVAVPTMKSLACNIYSNSEYIVPIMDAKGNRAYAGVYKWENNSLKTIKEQFACNIEDIPEIINSLDSDVIINGDGAVIYKEYLETNINKKIYFAPEQFSVLKASSICFLAYEMILEGKIVSCDKFAPEYLRLSQAERMCKN